MSVLCIIPVHVPSLPNFLENLNQLLSIDVIDEVRVCASSATVLPPLNSIHPCKLSVIHYHSYGQIHQRSAAYSYAPISSKYVLNIDQDISISASALQDMLSFLENYSQYHSCSIPCISLNQESFSSRRPPSSGFIYPSGFAVSPSSNSVPVSSTWTKGGCTLWRSIYACNLFNTVNLPRCTWSPLEDLIHSFESHHLFSHIVLFSHCAYHLNVRFSGQPFSFRLVWKGLNITFWRLLFICSKPDHFSILRLYIATSLRVFHINYFSKICVNFGYLLALTLFLPFVFFPSASQKNILNKYIVYFDRLFNTPT